MTHIQKTTHETYTKTKILKYTKNQNNEQYIKKQKE
jgi:hypothetical protein